MSTDELQKAYDEAMQNAYDVQAQKDQALEDVKAEYGEKLRAANVAAAEARQALGDAQAVDGLEGREDAAEVADKLGLTLG